MSIEKVGADKAPAQQGGRAKCALMKLLRSRAVEQSTLSSPLRILAAADGGTAPSPELIVDATEDDFETVVVARSHRLPVLVDIGADWCSPCRVLRPLLHRLATGYEGRFILANVDADENMRIAGRHKVRGFPTVIAYSHGVEIDRFHSAQTEGFVRRFLDNVIRRHAEHGHAALLAPTPMVTPEGK